MADSEQIEEQIGAPPVIGKKVITASQARDFVAEQKKRGIVSWRLGNQRTFSAALL